MSQISINLLPQEVLAKEKDQLRKKRYIRGWIGVLTLMIIFTSLVLGWRILQDNQLNKTDQDLSQAQGQITALNEQETLTVYLNQRLSTIKIILATKSKQAQSYSTISSLIPQSIRISNYSADKRGNITMSIISPDSGNLKSFFDKLVDPQQNQGTISQVNLGGLSRASDNIYRADLGISVR